MADYDWLIVGAGFTGAVVAERIASELGQRVLLIDRRDHIAGNAYDYPGRHGILVHQYGPHIFHTNSEKVWRYLSRFTGWRPYYHRVLGMVEGNPLPLPFNFDSIERAFPPHLADAIARKLIEVHGFGKKVPILKLRGSEHDELKFLAEYVYEQVFKNYTIKQWELSPEELDPQVTARVPVYASRDGRYFQDRYQAMPAEGYTAMFRRILDHPLITVKTDTAYKDVAERHPAAKVVYTGPIDEYFDYAHGPLPYRSLRFRLVESDEEQVQPVGTVNYPNEYDFTRITEMKHLTGQKAPGSILIEEYPEAYEPGRNEPYYPIPTPATAAALEPYRDMAAALKGKVWFAGRLGDYAYYNMDQACARALALFEKELAPAATAGAA